MIFDGHKLYKIGNGWVFDLTEFVGYKVKWKGAEIESFHKAFTVTKSSDNKTYEFIKIDTIPVGVMRKAKKIIEEYLREAMING